MVQAFTEYTALAEHKTVQDQEYEILMNARYLRNTDVLISLASDFLFQVRETWKWHLSGSDRRKTCREGHETE